MTDTSSLLKVTHACSSTLLTKLASDLAPMLQATGNPSSQSMTGLRSFTRTDAELDNVRDS